MIKEVTGDILLSKADAIAHGVSPFDHFDSGLALSLREEWPSMFKDFKHYCHQHNPKSGSVWVWRGVGNTCIVNLMTQETSDNKGHGGHGGRASEVTVNKALHELRKVIEHEGFKSIALPRLATGVGGLKWEQVEPIIRKHLGDLSIDVLVYTTYVKGKAGE